MGWNCLIKHFEEKSKTKTETKREHKVLKIIDNILLITPTKIFNHPGGGNFNQRERKQG